MPKSGFPNDRREKPKVLTFDTSGPFVSVGVAYAGRTAGRLLDMPKGQAEALFPTIEALLTDWDWAVGDIDAIGVATGPGNFTGIRISVSAARGLGLALGIPVFGVSQFELAYGSASIPPTTLISVPAPRDFAYVWATTLAGGEARLIDPAEPPQDFHLTAGTRVVGHRATEIGAHFGADGDDTIYKPDPTRMAAIAEEKYREAASFPPPPVPNYVKPPDAAPARDTPPRIVP